MGFKKEKVMWKKIPKKMRTGPSVLCFFFKAASTIFPRLDWPNLHRRDI